MQTYLKKKLEIIVEFPYLRKLTDWLDDREVSGYTVLPALQGRGQDGSWHRDGLAGDAGMSVMVFCILDEAEAETIMQGIYDQLVHRIGIVTISDVNVIRKDHF